MRIAILICVLVGCGLGDEHEPETDMTEEELSGAGGTTIVQVNIYKGGTFADFPNKGPDSYGTATKFARMLDNRYRRASIIGMQEIESAANAEKIRQILEQETGHPWGVRHFHRSTAPDALPASQEAIFWRTDVHHVLEDFGTRQVEVIDTGAGQQTHSVRFGGLLLRRTGTQRDVAMFTGKLVPIGTESGGRKLDNSDRALEVARLDAWIDQKLEGHRHAARVIALDANADYGTAPWQRLRTQYWDDSDDRPTHWTFGARRIDFLFWDHDAGPRRTDGFLLGPFVSPDFGSDHRAVVARVRVRE